MNATMRRRRKQERAAADLTLVMNPGESFCGHATDPVLTVVGFGPTAYLWIGNDRGACWATLDTKGLKRLVGRFLRAHNAAKQRAR